MRVPFTLAIYEPLPGRARLDTIQLDPQLTGIRWSNALPGGFAALDITSSDASTLVRPYMARELASRPLARVVLTAGGACVWEGRLTQPHRPAGKMSVLHADGYGISAMADSFVRSTDTSASTSGACLAAALGLAAPVLRVGPRDRWVDPGIPHTLAEFDGMYPADIVSQLISEGGAGGETWDWWVYEDRIVNFVPRVLYTQPRYRVDIDPSYDPQDDYTGLYGSITLRYTDAATNAQASVTAGDEQAFLDNFGFIRRGVLPGATLTAASAAATAATLAATASRPVTSATLTRAGARGLQLAAGGEVPAYLARSGEWLAAGSETPMILVRVEHDATAESTVIELGAPSPGIPQTLQELRRRVSVLSGGRHPRTGGKVF